MRGKCIRPKLSQAKILAAATGVWHGTGFASFTMDSVAEALN